jgi:hypothetical protein
VVGYCEYGDEPSGSGATALVSLSFGVVTANFALSDPCRVLCWPIETTRLTTQPRAVAFMSQSRHTSLLQVPPVKLTEQ